MKTFVYEKKGSRVIAVFNKVTTVICMPKSNNICIITDDGMTHVYDTKIYKSTTYQN